MECVAHDGLGDSSQKLLDEHGCPLDQALMPTPKYGPIRPIALMRHQEAISKFPAFKFPDRDRLHLNCGLQICRGLCPKVGYYFQFITKAENLTMSTNNYSLFDRLTVVAATKAPP